LEVRKPKIVLCADRLADFAAYRRDERGLSPATIRCQSWHVEKFWSWMDEQNRGFDNVSLEDVDAFLAEMGKRGWGRVSVAASASALRGFFSMQQYVAGVRPNTLSPRMTTITASAAFGRQSSRSRTAYAWNGKRSWRFSAGALPNSRCRRWWSSRRSLCPKPEGKIMKREPCKLTGSASG
jgi:hypothetical protein